MVICTYTYIYVSQQTRFTYKTAYYTIIFYFTVVMLADFWIISVNILFDFHIIYDTVVYSVTVW